MGVIAGIPEPVDSIRGGAGGERLGVGRLELAKGLLDRGEVRRVGREDHQRRPRLLDQEPNIQALLDAQVVEDDDLAGLQGGDQDVLDGGRERIVVKRSLARHGGLEASRGERGDERRVVPIGAGHGPVVPVAFGGPHRARRQGDVGMRLVDEDKLAGIAVAERKPEQAATLWGAAEALLDGAEAAVYVHTPDRAAPAHALAAARSRLDSETWDNAWNDGRAMSLDQAVSYALGRDASG